MKLLRWFAGQTIGFYVNMLGLVVFAGGAFAATTQTTSYDVTNNPQMYLDASITATQTSNIKLSALTRNGETVIFPNMTGGVLRIKSGSRVEDLSFTGATVNSSSKVVTLAGVTRNICWNIANRFVSCGDGLSFAKGSTVELNVDARLLNFKLNKDRVNLLTGSGQISGTGTGQSIIDLPCVTTTQRDNMTNVSDGNIICNSTLGTFQYRSGGSWVSFGSGSINNATDSAFGKVQMTTLDALQNRAATGSTGARNVLGNNIVVKNGSGAETYGRILQAGNNGALSPSLGGTGLPSPTASGVLIGNGNKNSMLQVVATTSGQLLRANSKLSWFAWTPTGIVTQWSQPNEKLTNSNGTQNFTTNYTLPAGFATGSMVVVEASGTGASTGAFYRYGLKLGSTQICESNQMDPGSTNHAWKLRGELTVKRNGAAGQLFTNCTINGGAVSTQSGGIVSINTTTTNAVNVTLRSNGTTAYSYLINLIVTPFLR